MRMFISYRSLIGIPASSSLLAVSLVLRHASIVTLVIISEEIFQAVNTGQLIAVSTLLSVMFLNWGLLQLLPTGITGKVDHSLALSPWLSLKIQIITIAWMIQRLTGWMLFNKTRLREYLSSLDALTFKRLFDLEKQVWQFLYVLITAGNGTTLKLFSVFRHVTLWGVDTNLNN